MYRLRICNIIRFATLWPLEWLGIVDRGKLWLTAVDQINQANDYKKKKPASCPNIMIVVFSKYGAKDALNEAPQTIHWTFSFRI